MVSIIYYYVIRETLTRLDFDLVNPVTKHGIVQNKKSSRHVNTCLNIHKLSTLIKNNMNEVYVTD